MHEHRIRGASWRRATSSAALIFPLLLPGLAHQVGLFDVRVQLIDSAEGSFDATLWLQLSWIDARLAWPVETYNGTLQRAPGSLWEPFVYLANIQSSEADSLISETSSTVSR